jgi:hypothetical protein
MGAALLTQPDKVRYGILYKPVIYKPVTVQICFCIGYVTCQPTGTYTTSGPLHYLVCFIYLTTISVFDLTGVSSLIATGT